MKHSYTSTRDFSCKRRYYHQHIARDVERESTPAMEYGWLVHKGLEQRLAEGEPLPDNLAQFESFAAAIDGARARGLIVDVERRLGMRRNLSACDFHDPGCWWCGVLDVVIRRDSTALLYDWKTGKRREDPAELKIHAALLKAITRSWRRSRGVTSGCATRRWGRSTISPASRRPVPRWSGSTARSHIRCGQNTGRRSRAGSVPTAQLNHASFIHESVVSLARAVERSGDRGRAVSVAGRLHPGCANAARVLDQADQERTAHGMPAGSTVVDRISFLTLFVLFFMFA